MQPIDVRKERVVVVPIDVLWQIIEPAETLAAWLPICDRSELLDGIGLGRRQRMHLRWGRKVGEIDQEVTEYQPHARLGWKHLRERLDGKPAPRLSTEVTLTIELQPAGAGTKVILRSRNIPANLFASFVLRMVARPRIRKAFDRALDKLAASGAAR